MIERGITGHKAKETERAAKRDQKQRETQQPQPALRNTRGNSAAAGGNIETQATENALFL